MKTSRQQVLDYVRSQRAVTTDDVSRALKMTQANVRHHMAILARQGIVQVVGQRPVQGRGRPANLYGLSSQAAGHNLDRLAAALLNEVFQGIDDEEKEALLWRLARRLGNLAAGSQPSEQGRVWRSLTQRLSLAVQILNDMNYQARWEARPQSPHLVLGYCPYAPLLADYPEICRLDAHLIEYLLDVQVEQIARLALDSRGLRHCTFSIKQTG